MLRPERRDDVDVVRGAVDAVEARSDRAAEMPRNTHLVERVEDGEHRAPGLRHHRRPGRVEARGRAAPPRHRIARAAARTGAPWAPHPGAIGRTPPSPSRPPQPTTRRRAPAATRD